jgi:hypothetical protein
VDEWHPGLGQHLGEDPRSGGLPVRPGDEDTAASELATEPPGELGIEALSDETRERGPTASPEPA